MSTPWLTVAHYFEGERRIRGPEDNPHIVELFRLAGFEHETEDTPWCAAFVGACLRLAGFDNPHTLRAADYASFGERSEARRGAIVLFEPLEPGTSGHVGFLDRQEGDTLYVLGGNQGKASEVRISAYSRSRVRAYRWPVKTAPLPARSGLPTILEIAPGEAPPHLRGGSSEPERADRETRPIHEAWAARGASDAFERVQAIIYELEGGFRKSADENGGAVKFGISRTTLGEWRGHAVSIDDVRDLDRAEAHEIYHERYWKKIGGDDLPVSVALVVHNLAVLGGPWRAVTFLQRALDRLGSPVEIDGDIGPETLGAVRGVDPAALIEAFADIQRAFHRSSSKAQYISGWLARLDKIERTALSWVESEPARREPPEPDLSEIEFDRDYLEGLAFGASGRRVSALQAALRDAGYHFGAQDGEFDRLTRAAVLGFQADNGLTTTGVADAATLVALDKNPRRQLASGRVGADAEALREKGSRTVAGADNVKLAGLVSSLFGALGLGDSAVVGIGETLAGAGQAAPAAKPAFGQKLIDAFDKALSAPKGAGGPLESLIATIKEVQGAALDKVISPENLQTLNYLKKAIASSKLGGRPEVIQFFEQLPAAVANVPVVPAGPARQIGSIFDLLPGLFTDGTLQTLSQGVSAVADSVVPGFGGSVVALGVGLAARHFADRIIAARVDDHRTGANQRI